MKTETGSEEPYIDKASVRAQVAVAWAFEVVPFAKIRQSERRAVSVNNLGRRGSEHTRPMVFILSAPSPLLFHAET